MLGGDVTAIAVRINGHVVLSRHQVGPRSSRNQVPRLGQWAWIGKTWTPGEKVAFLWSIV